MLFLNSPNGKGREDLLRTPALVLQFIHHPRGATQRRKGSVGPPSIQKIKRLKKNVG